MSALNSVTQKLPKTSENFFPGSKKPYRSTAFQGCPIDPDLYFELQRIRSAPTSDVVAIVEGEVYLQARAEITPDAQEVLDEIYGRNPK